MRIISVIVLAIAGIAGTGAQAQTATDFGSVVYESKRNCPADAAAACNGQGTAQRTVQSASAGGSGKAATSTMIAAGTGVGSNAYGSATFGGFGLPEIKASATAVGAVRISTFVAAYQSYTYNGEDDFDLLLNATFHIDGSSTDGADGTHPGGAIASAGFAIWDADDFFAYSDPYFAGDGGFSAPAALYNQGMLFGTFQCEDFAAYADPVDLPHGARATNWNGKTLSGGETSIGTSQQNCEEETLTISKGDQFVIAAYAQVVTNRDGFVDATGTFNVNFDPAMGEANIAAFQSGVQLGLSPVPEPASWAMMIVGFGAIGGAARRSRSTRLESLSAA